MEPHEDEASAAKIESCVQACTTLKEMLHSLGNPFLGGGRKATIPNDSKRFRGLSFRWNVPNAWTSWLCLLDAIEDVGESQIRYERVDEDVTYGGTDAETVGKCFCGSIIHLQG